MRRLLHPSWVTGLALAGLASAAMADDEFAARLRPFEEVPSVSSTASGSFKAWFDDKSHTLRYELSFQRLEGDVRQAHIHLAQKGVNGGIMVWLCQTSFNMDPTGLAPQCPQSGTVHGVISSANVIGPSGQGIDANEFREFIAAMRGGVAYANVHSVKFPGGELRGQVRDDD